MARFDLSDDEWAIVAPFLPKQGVVRNARTTAKCSTVFSTFCEPAHHGVTCHSDMVHARQFTTAMFDGVSVVFGKAYLNLLPRSVKTLWSS